MTKVWKDISTDSAYVSQDTSFNINLSEIKIPVKKFHVESISEVDDELRKSILRQIKDFKFERSYSKFNNNTFCYYEYKLPIDFNPLKQMAVIIRMEPKSYISDKCDRELCFIILNNEVNLKHKPKGTQNQLIKAGEKLNIPTNKRFYMSNDDVDTTHLLLLMQPDLRIPSFLI